MTRPSRRRAALTVLTAAAVTAVVAGATRYAPAAEHRIDGRSFTLPDGFTLERAAGPPLVDRPITADFDERGRLYVSDSSGSNDKVEVQLARKPHRVVRLEDADGDGRFDRRTVFADGLMFPEGTLWYAGSLYVSAPPSIWKLTDTDDDGVADVRVEWFRGKTLTGCANDLHGPYLGPDGWVYWCKGAFARQSYERPGKPPFVTRASHVFRCRPDGTGVEPVLTGGMDNPVDVVFTPGGERVLSCTFFQDPADGRRDGLIHAVYGGVYGKVHDVLDGHARTGPDVMPVLTHLGPAAPCGLAAYESTAFGAAYKDNLFACCFNLRKVTRHVLTPAGSTFTSRDEDFLATTDFDFHPTDVVEDADGSLLVVDTGGWYKLCCPTSQLPKPDVLGAVYRVRKAGAPKPDDPRGLALAWPATAGELVGRLDDPRPAVRRRAVHGLGELGGEAAGEVAGAVKDARTPGARRDAVWAATRIDHDAARAAVRSALADPDETVRQAAAHSAGLRRDALAAPGLLALLKSPSAQNRRAAAEALGRVGDPAAVSALLAAAGVATDRILEHSIIYAMIETADPKSTAAGLASGDARTRRAAVVALDQMGDGGLLRPADVAPGLASPDPATRGVAFWVAGRRPGWSSAVVGVLAGRLADGSLSVPERDELADRLARFARGAEVESLLLRTAGDASSPRVARRTALRAMARSGRDPVPASWSAVVATAVRSGDPELAAEAVAVARALPWPREPGGALAAALVAVGDDPGNAAPLRLGALAAVPGGMNGVGPGTFAFLLGRLDPENPVAERADAADALAHATLDAGQLRDLAHAVRSAGPLEVEKLLAAFARTDDEAVGLALVDALKASPALASLRAETLAPRLARFGPGVKARAAGIFAGLNPDAASQKARLEDLLPKMAGGDVRRGQAVFNGPRAACLSCHAVGYVGGRLGPDLSRVGQLRSERDLLESVLFPSLSFVRSYEPVTVATRDGRVVSGILKADSAAEVVLAVSATEEAHVPRAEVEAMRPGTVSVMPAGLDQQLTRQELADLIAFLKSRQ